MATAERKEQKIRTILWAGLTVITLRAGLGGPAWADDLPDPFLGDWQGRFTRDGNRRPRYDDDGRLLRFARVTVSHNGKVVQNDLALPGGDVPTNRLGSRTIGRIRLQHHGDPVAFRNIWLLELKEGEKQARVAHGAIGDRTEDSPMRQRHFITGSVLAGAAAFARGAASPETLRSAEASGTRSTPEARRETP
jgi:hypothetical protein